MFIFCWFSFSLVDFPLSLRLHRPFSDELSRPEGRNTEILKQEVEENVSHLLTSTLMLLFILRSSLHYTASLSNISNITQWNLKT